MLVARAWFALFFLSCAYTQVAVSPKSVRMGQVEGGRGQVAGIVGEPGVGKSRLSMSSDGS